MFSSCEFQWEADELQSLCWDFFLYGALLEGETHTGAAALDKKESEAAGSCKRATRTFPKHFSEKVL